MIAIRSPVLGILAAAAAVASTAHATDRVRPEQVVPSAPNGIVCISKETLRKFFGHIAADEVTKAKGMMPVPCAMLKEGTMVKVLSVQGDIVEIVLANSQATDGVWAPIETVQPKK